MRYFFAVLVALLARLSSADEGCAERFVGAVADESHFSALTNCGMLVSFGLGDQVVTVRQRRFDLHPGQEFVSLSSLGETQFLLKETGELTAVTGDILWRYLSPEQPGLIVYDPVPSPETVILATSNFIVGLDSHTRG